MNKVTNAKQKSRIKNMPSKTDINPSTGKAYAVNPKTGNWDDNYWATVVEPSLKSQFQTAQSASSSSSFSDPQSSIKEAIRMTQEANKPAVESLRASMPEVSQKYAQTKTQLQGQSSSLEERYKNLLSSIKGQGESDVNRQTVITSNELGKRGITGDSTIAQQEIQNATSPLRQKYATLEKETGLAREDALKNLQDSITGLTSQETADLRSIQNAIAQLESGASSSGIQTGLSLYSQQLAQQNADRQFSEQKRQNDIAEAIRAMQSSQPSYMSLGEGSSLVDPATGRILVTAPKTYKEVQSQLGDPLGLL